MRLGYPNSLNGIFNLTKNIKDPLISSIPVFLMHSDRDNLLELCNNRTHERISLQDVKPITIIFHFVPYNHRSSKIQKG